MRVWNLDVRLYEDRVEASIVSHNGLPAQEIGFTFEDAHDRTDAIERLLNHLADLISHG